MPTQRLPLAHNIATRDGTLSKDAKVGNAFIEVFNSILETELLQVRYFRKYEDVYGAMMGFIEFYNNRRLHGSIGNR